MSRTLACAAFWSSWAWSCAALFAGPQPGSVSRGADLLAPATPRAATQLRVARNNATSKRALPCQCQAASQMWNRCNRTIPKCVFIDLGAADGNSFNAFLRNEYGPIANCPSKGLWEAILVEANPRFKQPLEKAAARFPGAVETYPAMAAYMCEGKTSFYLDTVTAARNFWGSSMSSNHPDVRRSGKQKVTVGTVNLNRVLYEQTIPGDYVLVKMDIEGAEYDIIPCLAHSPASALMDALWMEQHDPSWGVAGNSQEVMEKAKTELQSRGVYMPKYFSPTLLTKRAELRMGSRK